MEMSKLDMFEAELKANLKQHDLEIEIDSRKDEMCKIEFSGNSYMSEVLEIKFHVVGDMRKFSYESKTKEAYFIDDKILKLVAMSDVDEYFASLKIKSDNIYSVIHFLPERCLTKNILLNESIEDMQGYKKDMIDSEPISLSAWKDYKQKIDTLSVDTPVRIKKRRYAARRRK